MKSLKEERMQKITAISFCSIFAIIAVILAGCSSSSQAATSQPQSNNASSTRSASIGTNRYGIATLDGYTVSLFTNSTKYTQPDSVIVDGSHVFIDYQNGAAKDGSDNLKSTIVEYDMNGKELKTYICPGHSDGMRMDPTTKLIWVTSNEDGNPKMETIDPASGTVTPYVFAAPPHGGGYDDVYFLNGSAYIAASNPNVNSNGVNVFPAVDKMTLSNGKVNLTPILMGNATAIDTTTTPNSKVSLNEVDPDSLTVDTKGNLILIDQGGLEIVSISNPGTPQQKVTRVPTGTQLDDTVWATSSKGRLLITDGTTNQTYWLTTAKFGVGDVYTQTPNDSGVAGLIGTVDLGTGIVTPIAIGFAKPTGMLFVPDSQS
jgi:sugar lactone lactonase YvrE